MTKKVDFPKSNYLSDLAILPVINFIDAYHSYRDRAMYVAKSENGIDIIFSGKDMGIT